MPIKPAHAQPGTHACLFGGHVGVVAVQQQQVEVLGALEPPQRRRHVLGQGFRGEPRPPLGRVARFPHQVHVAPAEEAVAAGSVAVNAAAAGEGVIRTLLRRFGELRFKPLADGSFGRAARAVDGRHVKHVHAEGEGSVEERRSVRTLGEPFWWIKREARASTFTKEDVKRRVHNRRKRKI
jgi:hypothetical protein